jgi:hypothetical protein
MVGASVFEIVPIDGLAQSERRGIVFLTGLRQLDAASVFAALPETPELTLLSRFDHWISGQQGNSNWYHGFTGRYKKCFVFKYKLRNVGQRLYGFLCNPQPISRPSFEVCVLHTHDSKTQWETDESVKELAISLSMNTNVVNILKFHFPDNKQTRRPN